MNTTSSDAALEALIRSLEQAGVSGIETLYVLGSGLGAFADQLADPQVVPYEALEGMPHSSVPGHAGRFVAGEIGGRRLLVQQGRVHLYEGWSAREVTLAIRALTAVGVRHVLLTNAAGGLRREWPPGTLMRLTDHVNLQAVSPLSGSERGAGNPYDPALAGALDHAAETTGVALERGVYAGLRGPTYETPAEIGMLRRLGADAVGMSTVAEALAAHAGGARVAAISLITNYAAGITEGPLDHEEVIAAGQEAAERFSALLAAAVGSIAALREE